MKIKHTLYNLLRRSEHYIKTDMVYLTKNLSVLTVSRIISALLSFVLAIAFANLLPKEVYGNYKFVLSIIAFFSITSLGGMNTAVKRAIAHGNEEVVIPATKAKALWSIIGSVGLFITAAYYWHIGSFEISLALLLGAFFLPSVNVFTIYQAYLEGHKKFTATAIRSLTVKLISTALIVGLIYFSDSLLGLIAIYLIVTSLLTSYYFVQILKKYLLSQKTDTLKIQETLKYGKYLSGLNFFGELAGRVENIIVYALTSPIDLALFAFAKAPLVEIRMGFKNVRALVFPKFATRSIKEIKKGLTIKFIQLSLATLAVMVGYIAIAPWIFTTFFPAYTDAIPFTRLYALTFIDVPLSILGIILETHMKKSAMNKIYIGVPILKIILMLILTFYFGIYGVIYALIATSILMAIFHAILIVRARDTVEQ